MNLRRSLALLLAVAIAVTLAVAEAGKGAPSVVPSAARAVVVPRLIGQRLDVAEYKLVAVGLRYKEIGGGTFGILVPSNWKVCQQIPSGGAKVAKGTRVALIVEHFQCS
jgi:hypothetical protein